MIDKYSKIQGILLKQGKFYISLELDRIKKILDLFGNPQDKLKIIHVAGTNGKGSTCAILNEIYMSAGYKVGSYTSPHLIKYNERIKINNKNISDDDFYSIVLEIKDYSEKYDIHLTEFEILTAVMFIYFERKKVDIAIVEVGLGGRFDATNCIKKPLICVITSISKDHTERLGDTIEQIAYEKAGIIKNGVGVVINDTNLGKETILKVANEKKSEVIYSQKAEICVKNDENILFYKNNEYKFNLRGKYQAENASLALKVVDILKSKFSVKHNSIINALKNVSWRGRFEYIKEKNLIIDGCHNPDGARILRESLDYYLYNEKRIFIYTSLKNKDYKLVQKNLFRNEDTIYHYKSSSYNFISKNDVKNAVGSLATKEVAEMINDKNRKDLLIICGSLYALGDILGTIDLCS